MTAINFFPYLRNPRSNLRSAWDACLLIVRIAKNKNANKLGMRAYYFVPLSLLKEKAWFILFQNRRVIFFIKCMFFFMYWDAQAKCILIGHFKVDPHCCSSIRQSPIHIKFFKAQRRTSSTNLYSPRKNKCRKVSRNTYLWTTL